MALEVQKREPDLQVLDNLMAATFWQRRQEIIGDEPLIAAIMDRWPALFSERQIIAEFNRIVTKDLVETFLGGLDSYKHGLLQLYRVAVESGRKVALSQIMDCLQREDTNQIRRAAALLGLPCYLSEDSSSIIRMLMVKPLMLSWLVWRWDCLSDTKVLFRMLSRLVFNVAVVVEEKIIVHNLKDVPTGFAMLLGAIYCLNLEYPKKMKYTFEFLQKAIMGIQAETCSARVHGLRNKLLRYHM
ncbi:hypothetical protein ACEWY4_021393 [Coilia grayii]|uniref:Uncharacterized protein n=1 Tax=Coilia grayii TaxID=363190 RepID=A0ABD1JAM5_9TELE